tara:strand:+ start:4636 stop:4818 length:183 start_codon:yes stop_codon:yes gene_type:complete
MNTDNWRNDFSVEYYLIKKATSKQHRKNTLKIIGYSALFVLFGFVFMYASLDFLLWLYYV